MSPLRFSGWLSTGLTYDMLVGADPAGQPVPAFAESWSVADDGVTWTIKIRPGMTWSDGEPATAEDVRFTIEYLAPSTSPVWGGAYFSSWGLGAIESVTVEDPETLTIVTKPPQRDWLPVSRLFVLPEHIWKDVPIEDAVSTFDPALPSVGTGPFVLTEVQPGQFRRFERNDAYWGDAPAISEILLIPYKSQDALATALAAGEIDIASNVAIGQVDQLAADPAIEVLAAHQNGFTMLAFNVSGGGTSTDAIADPAFRDAIGYALDGATLVDRVFQGHAKPGQSLVSPANVPNFADLAGQLRSYDPAEAARRLDAAGYLDSDGDGVREDKAGAPIDLKLALIASEPETALVAQFVAEWLSAVGVKVTPVALEVGAYYDTIYKPATDMHLYVSGYDANQFVLTQGTSNANGMFWSNPDYDAAWETYTATFDPADRLALATDMSRIFLEDAPGHVLAYQDQLAAYRTDRFTGWTDPAHPDEFTLMSLSWPMPMFGRLQPVAP